VLQNAGLSFCVSFCGIRLRVVQGFRLPEPQTVNELNCFMWIAQQDVWSVSGLDGYNFGFTWIPFAEIAGKLEDDLDLIYFVWAQTDPRTRDAGGDTTLCNLEHWSEHRHFSTKRKEKVHGSKPWAFAYVQMPFLFPLYCIHLSIFFRSHVHSIPCAVSPICVLLSISFNGEDTIRVSLRPFQPICWSVIWGRCIG